MSEFGISIFTLFFPIFGDALVCEGNYKSVVANAKYGGLSIDSRVTRMTMRSVMIDEGSPLNSCLGSYSTRTLSLEFRSAFVWKQTK